MKKPLEGVRVVELSTFVAAPVCGRMMADMGAEVIKIESPGGDQWRYTTANYKSDVYNEDHNPIFDLYNSGKQHIALNLKSEEGMETMHKLLEKADVFLTNNRPAALERLGLGYEQLKEKYPSLIYALIIGYGEKGPEGSRPAFDGTAFWARGGFLRDMPDADHYLPLTPPGGIGDTFTGYLLLMQIVASLYRRYSDGKGELVKAGLYHNAVFGMATMNILAQEPSAYQYPQSRMKAPPHLGAYCCSDGEWIYYAPGTTKNLEEKLARMTGMDFLLEDPRYTSKEARMSNIDYIYDLFKNAYLQKPSDYWLKKLEELDIAGVRMHHFSDVSKDEQAWANDYLEHVTFPDGQKGILPTSPLEMESVGKIHSQSAHKVGQDTVTVLQSMGYSQEQIDAMIQSGAVSDKRKM